ncbi:MAG: YhgE/Pip domain-containing protein [Eubacterium sp.]|nr:YhgE/Pip domain-containing protein [Eubacterium sp.]
MKNIIKIYKRDLKKIFTNSMAIILAVGIAVLPSLYAWFNIYANWDPYGSTGNMQIAVVIEDEGYKFRDIEIDVGERIKSNLEANDLIDWQFVSKNKMLEGIKAGEYYAGIEIPKGFSKSLTSIVTNDFKQPSITYYANEKKNAIATKITDKVVQTIQQEVNESFVTTVINVVSSLIDLVADATNNSKDNVLDNLAGKIENASGSINNVRQTVKGFEDIMILTQTLGDSIDSQKLEGIMKDSGRIINDGTDMAKLLQTSVNGITSSVDKALSKSSSGLDEAAAIIKGIDKKTGEAASKPVSDAITRLSKYKANLESVKTVLETVKSSLSVKTPEIDKLLTRVNNSISKTDKILSLLTNAQNGATKAEVKKITDEMATLSGEIASIRKNYKNNSQPIIDKNLANLVDMLVVTGDLVSDLNGQMPTLKKLAGSIDSTVSSTGDLVSALDKILANTQKQLKSLSSKIRGLGESEIINTLQNVAGTNSDQLGKFLACPVIVETDKIYGIENYGSAMAPFYSTLALWVGGVVLVAVITTKVKKKKEIGDVRLYQNYFGRMLTFLTFSIPQALIICLGDLYFLKIQCYDDFKFILAGVFAAFVFTVFIYSITFAFGDIGKAIAVICLVIQLGGSGGTFPIDVVPNFFQVLHPYMPFKFVIDAMRECVCGSYANDYWIDLLKLSAYLAVGLLFGLGVKFLVKKPIRFFEKQVEKTDLFG